MSLITNDEILEEFETFSIKIIDENIFNSLKNLCETYHLNAESLVEHWLAFSTQKKLKLSQETIEAFERDRLVKHERGNLLKTPTDFTKFKINTLISKYNKKENDSIQLLSTYDDSVQSKKRHLSTPDNEVKKRITNISDNSLNSPLPFCSTLSLQFQDQTYYDEIVLKFGPDIQNNLKDQIHVDIHLYEKEQKMEGIKYMFQRLTNRVGVLSNKVIELDEEYNKDIYNCENSLIKNTKLVGRVRSEMGVKLSSNCIFLDHPDFKNSIQLDIQSLSTFSLFSGQIICVEGSNINDKIFHVTKILEGLPIQTLDFTHFFEDINIFVACGPFSFSNNLLYEPMAEFLTKIQSEKPDICILCGPFIDSKQVENEEFLDSDCSLIFDGLMHDIIEVNQRYGVKFVIQPSQRDFLHDYVYPQPPFHMSNIPDGVVLVSDPCTLTINKICVGITSTDILLHMSADEIASSNYQIDRISRMIQHLLSQRSYYPLFPVSLDVNVDHELSEIVGYLPTTPHILLLPSDLKFFIKKIEECVCINPGRLSRGQNGGTYANIYLRNGQLTSHIKKI